MSIGPQDAAPDPPLVLRLELDFWSEVPSVRLVLSVDDAGSDWSISAAELGITDDLSKSPSGPVALPRAVADGLSAAAAAAPKGQPVWLDIAKPRGYMGALAWEEALTRVLERPVLRLTRLSAPPRESTATLEVAICCDPPAAAEVARVAERIRCACAAALSVGRRAILVHVFTTPSIHSLLVADTARDPRIVLHDPAGAPTCKTAVDGQGPDLPWFAWILQASGSRGLDALHFVVEADAADDRGWLLLSDNPRNDGTGSRGAAGLNELVAVQAALGAWAVIFSPGGERSPAANYRYLTDLFAQLRPGPAMFCDLIGDEASRPYRFLFSTEPSTAVVSSTAAIYCPPSMVLVEEGWSLPRLVRSFRSAVAPILDGHPTLAAVLAAANKSAQDRVAQHPEMPRWVASADRYLERAIEEYDERLRSIASVRTHAEDVVTSAAGPAAAGFAPSDDVVRQSLTELRSVLGRLGPDREEVG